MSFACVGRTLVLISALAGIIADAHCQQVTPREIGLVVAHNEKISLSAKDVDRILATASVVLQKQDSTSDTACPVNLKRMADLISIKASDLPEAIQSYEEMAHLRDLPGDMKVVREISWCGRPGIFIGCAGPDKGLMAVVPMENGVHEDILWAHEFGHYRGLLHTEPEVPRQMMLPVVSDDHRDVTLDECKKLTVAPLPVFGLRQKLDRRILVQPSPVKPQANPQAPLPPIRQFVRRLWIHGIPYEAASRYGADAVPELLAIIEDSKERPYWSNAILMIGLTASREQVPALIAFFQRGEGKLTASESRAKSATLLALGFIQNRSPSPAGRAFLLANSNPNRVSAPWMPKGIEEFQSRSREIARTAAVGLAFSGELPASARLAEIQISIERGAFSLKSAVGEPHGMIDELRKIHEAVSKQGLDTYLRSGN